MQQRTYFNALFRLEHIPILLITTALLFFTFWIWFGMPFYWVSFAHNFTKIVLTGLLTAAMLTLLLLPLNFTLAKRLEDSASTWTRLLLRFSARCLGATYLIYLLFFTVVYFMGS